MWKKKNGGLFVKVKPLLRGWLKPKSIGIRKRKKENGGKSKRLNHKGKLPLCGEPAGWPISEKLWMQNA